MSDDWLKKGVVIRKFFEEINNPKIKSGVVVGQTPDRHDLIFLIIGTNKFGSPEWNLPLSNSQYEFLAHVSYLDCSRVIRVLHDKVLRRVQENPNIVVGNLNKFDLEQALSYVEACPFVENKYKKIIRLNIPKPLIVEYK